MPPPQKISSRQMVYFGAYLRYSDVVIIGLLGFNSAYLLCNQNVWGKRFRGGAIVPCTDVEPRLGKTAKQLNKVPYYVI